MTSIFALSRIKDVMLSTKPKSAWRTLTLLTMLLVGPLACAAPNTSCRLDDGASVQVLGSGGPIADDARASSSYLLWIDGRARLLIDVGSGAFLRFGEAGAKFVDLDFIGISHFHTDHSADLPSLLKTGYFSGRQRELTIAGPGGKDRFPGLNAYLQSLLDGEHGAYGYLNGYLDVDGNLATLLPMEISADKPSVHRVFTNTDDDIYVDAMLVPHGIVPALSYRVTVGDRSVVFSSDQNGKNQDFVDFANDADLLVMHMAVPEDASGAAIALHARPSQIGKIASAAGVKKLVLSHLMSRSLRQIDANVGEVSERYDGEIAVANDLACYALN